MLLRRFLDARFSPGVGAMKIPITGLIQQYKNEYKKLKQQGKRITWRAYRVDPGDYLLVHFKVPSRTVKDVEYDVCVALAPKDGDKTNNFLDCHVKFFCNAPSFTYTGTAYLFHYLPDPDLGPGGFEEDRFGKSVPVNRITLFESKLDDNAFTQPPVQKNPYQIPMLFDNVVGMALIELTTKVPYFRVRNTAAKITEEKLLEQIKTFGQMTATRQKQVNIEKRERERQKEWSKVAEGKVGTTRKGESRITAANARKISPKKSSGRVSAVSPMKSRNVNKVRSR